MSLSFRSVVCITAKSTAVVTRRHGGDIEELMRSQTEKQGLESSNDDQSFKARNRNRRCRSAHSCNDGRGPDAAPALSDAIALKAAAPIAAKDRARFWMPKGPRVRVLNKVISFRELVLLRATRN